MIVMRVLNTKYTAVIVNKPDIAENYIEYSLTKQEFQQQHQHKVAVML